jgi:hypothetical protein
MALFSPHGEGLLLLRKFYFRDHHAALYISPECGMNISILSSIWAPRAWNLIPSIWGHHAGNPAHNPEDAKFIDAAVRELLAR